MPDDTSIPDRAKLELPPDACDRGHSELVPLGADSRESLRRLLMAVNLMQLRRRFPSWHAPSPMTAKS